MIIVLIRGQLFREAEFEIQNQMEMEDLEGSTEKHHIRWNAFESNICKTLGDLNGDKNFEDVTLVCDGQYLEANKVVSSVASSFFHRILKQNPHPHPLICLVGIKLSDFDALLNFAYFGEFSVATSDLDTFLATAETLEMKGLVPDKNHSEDVQQQPPVSLTQSSADVFACMRFLCHMFVETWLRSARL